MLHVARWVSDRRHQADHPHEKAYNLMSRACSFSMFTSFVEPITFMENSFP
jgi:hypothetical protein